MVSRLVKLVCLSMILYQQFSVFSFTINETIIMHLFVQFFICGVCLCSLFHNASEDRHAQKMEKMKCIIHYFCRVTKESKSTHIHNEIHTWLPLLWCLSQFDLWTVRTIMCKTQTKFKSTCTKGYDIKL